MLAAGALALLAGCGGSGGEAPTASGTDRERSGGPGSGPPEPQRFGVASHRADGNRLASGRGSIPGSTPLAAMAGGTPDWLVAARTASGPPLVAATLADGTVSAFRLEGSALREQPLGGAQLRPGQPPLLDARRRALVGIPGTSPRGAATAGEGRLLAPAANGDVLVGVGDRIRGVGALPDSRIAIGARHAAVVGGATSRYDHGVLGDALEGSTVFTLAAQGAPVVAVAIDAPAVIEGAAPILADLGGGRGAEVVVTVSDPEDGARLAAYELGGSGAGQAWRSEPIGTGQRWRHQIAVAPFGPEGERELVSVRTPHLDGTVEFHAAEGDRLVLRAALPGYSSHELGSANLDHAIAGDFDGSGRPEVVVPVIDGSALAGIERTGDGAREVWRVELPAPMSSNLAAVRDRSGALLLAAGLSDGRVLVWGG